MIVLALIRFLRRTRWSSIMAVVGMTLGITSIVAVHLVSTQVSLQLQKLVPEPLDQFNYLAHAEGLRSADYFQLQRHLRDDAQGITASTPIIDESAVVAGQRVRVVGVDVLNLSVSHLTESREATINSVEILSGVFVGPDVPELQRPVLGRLSTPGVVVADIGVAQELLGWTADDRISYVGLTVPSPRTHLLDWLERFFPGASAGLPELEAPTLAGFRVVPASSQHPALSFGNSVLFNVSALGGLALVVAWFLIYQVAVFWVRRLQGVFNRLFIVGVDIKVLMAHFVGLLVLVGLVATAAGLALGFVVARQLLVMSGAGDLEISLDLWIVSKALVSALAVCLVGGAWAFARVFPQTALRRRPRLQAAALVVMVIVLLAGLGLPATDLAGGFLSIALLSVFLVFSIPPLLRAFKTASRYLQGSQLLRMSLREVVWFPRDLSIALAGLSLAIASAIGVGLMVDSFRSEFSVMLDQRLSYDFVAQGSAAELQQVYAAGQADADTRRVRLYAEQVVRVSGTPVTVRVADVDQLEARRYGHLKALVAGEVLISEQLVQALPELQLTVGSTFSVAGQALRVAGVFKSFGDLMPRIVTSTPLPGVATEVVEVRLSAPVALVNRLSSAWPAIQWQDQQAIKRTALETFDRTFTITSILIAIAIGVGGIGLFVAITVLRLNQRASHRLLTFMGLSRLEQFGVEFARGMGVGLAANVFAVPLGLALGWILCAVINPRAFGWLIDLQISPQAIVQPLLWGMLAALIAGLTKVGKDEGDGFA